MGKEQLIIGTMDDITKLVRARFKSAAVTKPDAIVQGTKALTREVDSVVLNETRTFAHKLKSKYPSIETLINGEKFIKYEFSQMGSNPAFWAESANGELFYIKYARGAAKQEHLESELMASKLYRLAGINTPEIEICELAGGIKGIKSKYVGTTDFITDTHSVQEDFAADAWLANWDSLLNGNTIIQNRKSVKVDCGGALRYRAQGRLKPNFCGRVDELKTLVDGRNRESTRAYSTMSHLKLVNSFKKVTSISDDAIREVVKDEELARTLINRRNYMQRVLNEMEANPKQGEDLAKYFASIDKKIAQSTKEFSDNWNAVLKHIEGVERKPIMEDGIAPEVYATFNEEERVLASYVTEDFSDATNRFLRGGIANRNYDWWAKKGLDKESIPRYIEALKYAMDGLPSRVGTSYRWQPAGSFNRDFGVYKVGQKLGYDIPVTDPAYMSVKRKILESRRIKPKVGDIIEDPTIVSSGENLRGLEEFRSRLFYDSYRSQHPELVIIKGKNGKMLPSKVAGFRAYEKEVFYKPNTQYRYLGEKTITAPSEIEGFEEVVAMSEQRHRPGFVQEFKVIYLEEV